MIQKVAEAHAFRKAFPVVMSGLYIPEEMPDEQPQLEQGEANKAVPQFHEPEQIDAPAPEQQPDQEQEFNPDPEPVYMEAPKDGMLAAAVRKAETETDDADMDLFKA